MTEHEPTRPPDPTMKFDFVRMLEEIAAKTPRRAPETIREIEAEIDRVRAEHAESRRRIREIDAVIGAMRESLVDVKLGLPGAFRRAEAVFELSRREAYTTAQAVRHIRLFRSRRKTFVRRQSSNVVQFRRTVARPRQVHRQRSAAQSAAASGDPGSSDPDPPSPAIAGGAA